MIVFAVEQRLRLPNRMCQLGPVPDGWRQRSAVRSAGGLMIAAKRRPAFAVSLLTPTLFPEYRGEGVRSSPLLSQGVRWWIALSLAWYLWSSDPGVGPAALRADDAEVLAELKELEAPVVDPGFAPLLRQAADICRGGSQAFTAGKQWVAIAVGRAALETEAGKPLPLSDATKVARTKAHRNLAKLLHGYRTSARDSNVTKTITPGGRSEISELFRSVSKQDVEATLTRVEVVGTWQLDAGGSVAVMVAVGDPQHPAFQRRGAPPSAVKFRNEQWDGDWRNIFATRPAILTGGASLYQQQDAILILAVGKARLKGDPVADSRRELVASIGAAREALLLVKGLQVANQSRVTQESRRLTADEVTIITEVREILETTNS
ncbi:MAG: hypothetical protein NTY19_02615 [Planctomycetota bacterium]|nr:hypothetical protein [Planctomycetota bacterium]